ncbi:hypothetical protein WOLCODRAFT_167619 [Wolfiporia cocos MD-104 SS10]|uniref:Extracellular mutant protein 11 C-terminal domain-containing protein n=1 Tax=Wolfiporia cocos (strain MD-104) TaxID=742152 RepID=A0A2H3J7I4_WOLCO|nr:hypothetical protein WOLCODRAFT_167619 [Wolfiporia cocos MD-104 SS10]
MSARAPFVPQKSAPASHSNKPESSSTVTHDPFRPNGLLPASGAQVHASSLGDTQQKLSKSVTGELESGPMGINKPLNLSSFAKKPAQQPGGQNIPSRTRKSLEDASSRARSPKPFVPSSSQQALRTAARPSSPFFPTASGYVSINGFRAPTLPIPSKLQSAGSAHALAHSEEELNVNRAHIPTTQADSRDPVNAGATQQGPSQAPQGHDYRYSSPYNITNFNSRTRTASQPSLERINEAAEEDDVNAINEGQLHPGRFEDSGSQVHSMGPEYDNEGEDQIGQTLRRTSKRIHQVDEDDELDHGTETKRYKADNVMNGYGATYSRQASEGIHASPLRDNEENLAQGQAMDHSCRTNSVYELEAQARAGDERDDALHKLFGVDLDAYLEAHVEAYEEAKKKWTECSMDEWKAGADDLASKFAKMLEFVKEHMTTKLSLYASLHCAVAAHRTTLSEREQTLSDARESLLREGGAVVGRQANNTTSKSDKGVLVGEK